MKMRIRIIAFVWIATGFFMPVAFAQESEVAEKIKTSLQSANASKLAESFHGFIDLVIPEIEGMYSNRHAEQLMKAFFISNPVEKFTINHEGNSNDGSKYMIGTYKTTTTVTFLVYVLIKKTGDQEQLHELRFEQE